MLSLSELNPHNYPTTPEIDANLLDLLKKINIVRLAWAKVMNVTSGLRSPAQQAALVSSGVSNATKSNHLTGSAVDIEDKDGSLYKWCQENEQVLEEAELYCELQTIGWVHFQIVPPHSGHRWFFA